MDNKKYKNLYEIEAPPMNYSRLLCFCGMCLYVMENFGKWALSPNALHHCKQPTGFTMKHIRRAGDWQRAGSKEMGL